MKVAIYCVILVCFLQMALIVGKKHKCRSHGVKLHGCNSHRGKSHGDHSRGGKSHGSHSRGGKSHGSHSRGGKSHGSHSSGGSSSQEGTFQDNGCNVFDPNWFVGKYIIYVIITITITILLAPSPSQYCVRYPSLDVLYMSL